MTTVSYSNSTFAYAFATLRMVDYSSRCVFLGVDIWVTSSGADTILVAFGQFKHSVVDWMSWGFQPWPCQVLNLRLNRCEDNGVSHLFQDGQPAISVPNLTTGGWSVTMAIDELTQGHVREQAPADPEHCMQCVDPTPRNVRRCFKGGDLLDSALPVVAVNRISSNAHLCFSSVSIETLRIA